MDNVVEAIIEIPLKTKNKFEIDEVTGRIKLDRVLYSAMTYPAEYGYIEHTLSLDGDPLDILVIASEPTFPGCIVDARIIGYLHVIDNGYDDFKVISVVNADPRYEEINSLSDLSEFTLKEIKNFFENYKELQNIEVEVKEYHNLSETMKLIESCKARYSEKLNFDKMKIKNIRVTILDKNHPKSKASCDVQFSNGYILKDIRVVENNKNLSIAIKAGLFKNNKPSKTFLTNLESEIINKYKEKLKEYKLSN